MANAELLKNLKVSGSLEVDAVDANNVTDFQTKKYDTINTIQTRLMVHADWDVLDDVHAHISLDKNDRTYGTGSAANGSQDLNTIQSNILVDVKTAILPEGIMGWVTCAWAVMHNIAAMPNNPKVFFIF